MFSCEVREHEEDLKRYREMIEKRMENINKKEPAPIQNFSVPVYVKLITLIAERAEMGRQKHGTHLQANNGRNAMMDALQESIDLNQYLMQKLMETEEKKFAEEGRRFTFPTAKFAVTNNKHEQLAHMVSEALEFVDAFKNWSMRQTVDHYEEMLDEASDFIHSRETLIRLSTKLENDVDESERRVWNKNSERGYYGV